MQESAAPRRIGNYEIISHLKAGGMATLYLARRTGAAGFARHVAIKVVHPHLAKQNGSFVRMFLDEALLCARIHHPNVVHVEELGEADGVYFLVMEYVHGAALSQFMKALAERKRRLTPELAVSIAIQVADGLHAAHELRGEDGHSLGVVHRDVSPHNVLLSYAGHVKVIDFGIAKARSHVNETQTKSLKGKLRYMAPEQAFGRPVDRRTDVYALGIVLWELLTLRRLFDGNDDFALLDQVRDPVRVPPSKYAQGIPPALDAAVLRALSPNSDDRPASMQEFRRLLAEAVPGATALDAAHVADLLGAVMTDEIAAQRQMVPDTLSALRSIDEAFASARPDAPNARLSEPQREEILGALTTQADNASMPDEGDEDAPPVEPPRPTSRPRGQSSTHSEQPPIPETLPAPAPEVSAARAAEPTVSMRGPIKLVTRSTSSARPAQPTPISGPLLVDDLDDAPPKGKGGLIALIVLVLLAAAAAGVVYFRPDLVARLRGGPDPAIAAAERVAAAQAREQQAALDAQSAARVGELRVQSNVEHTQVLLFVGRGPLTVAGLPLGVAHEFVVIADGTAAVRALVPADAEWDDTAETSLGGADATVDNAGKRYDLPMSASDVVAPFAELDLGASTLPEELGTPGTGRGSVRIVTAPAGAKVYQLVGFTPDVRIADVRADEIAELIVFAAGHLPQRVVVGPSDWRVRAGARSAEVSVTLVARPVHRRREREREREPDEAPLVGAPGEPESGEATPPPVAHAPAPPPTAPTP